MITFIEGIIEEKSPNLLILNVNGIGYEIHISLNTYEELTERGSSIRVFTVHHIREDSEQLFGFSKKAEKDFFIKLNSVSGIGPALAIAILSGMPIATICAAINSNDSKMLSSIKGVGKKTAERMIVDLKDKIDKFQMANDVDIASSDSGTLTDAVMALVALGFRNADAFSAVKKIIASSDSEMPVEEIVRKALSNMQK